jgi:predicted O-methyltransferase YrrM
MIKSEPLLFGILENLQKGYLLFEKEVVELPVRIAGDNWNAGRNLSAFLYAYCMEKKPKVVVETGVANGITTRMIMHAIESYGGTLHSFDVLPECAGVYRGSGNWNFHLLPKKEERKKLSSITQQIPNIDLWLHDSDHGSSWQAFEYGLAWNRLFGGGMLISDDIDASPAWGEFSENTKSAIAIFDGRKIIGILGK